MRLFAAAVFLGALACTPQKLEPVGTSPPKPLPPPNESARADADAGLAVPEKVHHECELLIDAFLRAKTDDPQRPARKILDAIFDDPPPMPRDRLEWCRKELTKFLEH